MPCSEFLTFCFGDKKKLMETKLEKSVAFAVGNNVVFEEKKKKIIAKSSSSSGDDDDEDSQTNNKRENQRHTKEEDDSSKPSSSPANEKEISTIFIKEEKDHQIESAKAKMGEVKEENQRLKLLLSQLVKDYQSLQMRFLDILQQEEAKKSSTMTAPSPSHQENEEESDLVSLSLGRSSSGNYDRQKPKKKEKKISSNLFISNGKEDHDQKPDIEGLELGLECKFEPSGSTEADQDKNPSSESSLRKPEEEEATEILPPSKILKTTHVRSSGDHDQENVADQQMQLKKARVSVRTRCDYPTMNDGCQWRKYGQKTAKGNPCPRAYYRCSVSPTCPVRKQVQRCVEDMSVLITTYEGNHDHPLPLSATGMASTTSAAVSMLLSQSSRSQSGGHQGTSVSAPCSSTSTTSSSTAANNQHGLNIFNFAQNSRPFNHQYYFPNSSISTCNSHPTVTLDLTASPDFNYSSLLNRFSEVPRFSSSTTCLNFSSSPSTSSSLEGTDYGPTSWKSTSQLTFGAAFPNHNNSYILGSSRQPPQGNLYQSYMLKSNQIQMAPNSQSLSETISAATKAITSNPNFCSALAAALTSFVGNGGGGGDVPRDNQQAVPLKTAMRNSSLLSVNNNDQQQQKSGSLLLFPTSKSGSDHHPSPESR